MLDARKSHIIMAVAGVTVAVFSSGLGAHSSRGAEPTAGVAWRMVVNGLEIVEDGVGTTGRRSSYHGLSMEEDAHWQPATFSHARLKYHGRAAPAAGPTYDEGVLGYRIEDGVLVVSVAAGVGARDWHVGSDGELIGQGDLFVTVRQGEDVQHFALLNEMNGAQGVGHGGRFRPAQVFRYAEEDRVGHAVLLAYDDDIVLSGGDEGHTRGDNSPDGLDERAFARGGEDTGVGSVDHYSFEAAQPLRRGKKVTWHVSEWSVPLVILGDEEEDMELVFHIAPSCGNDQIGGEVVIPAEQEEPENSKNPTKDLT